MKIMARKRQPWSDLPFYLLILVVLLALPSGVLAETKYSFTYYLSDGSGDYYSGYVYAPDNWYAAGSTISYQPAPMGEAALGGYYDITEADSGSLSSYDKEEYITSFYDSDTGKTSNTFSYSTGQTTSGTALYVTDRSTAAEGGYVYDPSVPSSDPYFGNPDVCYSFDTSSSSANFLEVYITDLPYWNQPDSYDNSCSEVAGAIVLSYWANQGDSKLLPTGWQTSWPDDTANTTSYVSLIGELATDMNWSASGGTDVNSLGTGLVTYADSSSHGGYSFFETTYNVTSSRSSSWTAQTAALDAGRPVIDDIWWSEGGHSIVARGYWNDGHVVADLGWGTAYTNVKLEWNNTNSSGAYYPSAEIEDSVDFH